MSPFYPGDSSVLFLDYEVVISDDVKSTRIHSFQLLLFSLSERESSTMSSVPSWNPLKACVLWSTVINKRFRYKEYIRVNFNALTDLYWTVPNMKKSSPSSR